MKNFLEQYCQFNLGVLRVHLWTIWTCGSGRSVANWRFFNCWRSSNLPQTCYFCDCFLLLDYFEDKRRYFAKILGTIWCISRPKVSWNTHFELYFTSRLLWQKKRLIDQSHNGLKTMENVTWFLTCMRNDNRSTIRGGWGHVELDQNDDVSNEISQDSS